MKTVAIPAWTPNGLVPPVLDGQSAGRHRSPYVVSLIDMVMRFGTSYERRQILLGFLQYRSILHRSGFCSGFQWLSGSFVEHIELIDQRPPADIDIVTFLHSLPNFAPAADDAHVFDHASAKSRYRVDGYFVDLRIFIHEHLVHEAAYWYSVFAHRRTLVWKGFLQVELAPAEDAVALEWLRAQEAPGGSI